MKTHTSPANGSVTSFTGVRCMFGGPVEERWRERTFRRLVEFSERMRPAMPCSAERIRAVLDAGEVHDTALGGAMHSLNLTFDRMLLVVGAFLDGAAYELPASDLLRREITALVDLGLVQVARSGRSQGGWSGLTRRGQQVAVYAIYRIFTAATDDEISHE